MISFEKQLGRVVSVLPPFYAYPIKYGWGDIEQLNQVLVTRNANSHYPLVWLNLGEDTLNNKEKTIKRNAQILIAFDVDRSTLADLNPTVYEKYFDNNLDPICENLIKALESSGISKINSEDLKIERIPKYSVQNDGKQIIAIWHVLSLKAEIEFSNQQCFINTIKFKNTWQ